MFIATIIVGAVITHIRANDPDYARAGAIMILAFAAAVLRAITI